MCVCVCARARVRVCSRTHRTEGVGEREAEHAMLNEPVGAYVGCVGIIFALMYTSVYNDAQGRQSEIRNALAQEAGEADVLAMGAGVARSAARRGAARAGPYSRTAGGELQTGSGPGFV